MEFASTASLLRKLLEGCPSARAVILYGSAARGKATEKSDVDILVIAEEHCSIEVEPPISALVLTLEEWRRAHETFRAAVLQDGVLLYAKDIKLVDLLGMEPWSLIRYAASKPRQRVGVSRVVDSLENRNVVERFAPGVIMTPRKASTKVIEALLNCGAQIEERIILYTVKPMYCAYCPHCGWSTIEPDYEEAKKKLREHLLTVHRDKLQELVENLKRKGRGIPRGSLKGLAGYLAAVGLVHEC